MPKFLDAPSWYDDNGSLKTIEGDFTIHVGSGYNITFDVPHVGGTNIDRFGTVGTVSSDYYLLPAAKRPGQIPYYTNASGGYQTLPSGTSGQVLTSNGNAAPSWGTLPFYLHRIRLETTNVDAMANVYCGSSDSLTNNNLSGLINFLTEKDCNSIDSCLMANGVADGGVAVAVAGIYAHATGQLRFVTYELTKGYTELRDYLMATSCTVTETIIDIS